MDNKIGFFEKILGLDSSSNPFVHELASYFQLKHYQKESHFIQETEENTKVGFVKSGYLRTYLMDLDGNEAIIRFIKPLEFFSGGFAFNFPSPLNIQAITDVEIYQANLKEIQPLMRQSQEFVGVMMELLSIGSTKIMALLSNFIRLDGKQRYLLFTKEHPGLIDEIPHYYIANFLGITPVQLSRIRKQLADLAR